MAKREGQENIDSTKEVEKWQEWVTSLAGQVARATFLNQLAKIVIKIQNKGSCDLWFNLLPHSYQSRQKPDSETEMTPKTACFLSLEVSLTSL